MKKKEKQTEIDDTSETQVPTVKFSLLSAVENSHNGTVTDLVWLPEGIEVSKPNGSIQKSPAGDCNQFVTFARDGKVLFWDMRVKKDPKKGEIVWTPIYSVTLTRLEIAGDLAGVCFSFSFLDGLQPKMFATSMDGEVAYAGAHELIRCFRARWLPSHQAVCSHGRCACSDTSRHAGCECF